MDDGVFANNFSLIHERVELCPAGLGSEKGEWYIYSA